MSTSGDLDREPDLRERASGALMAEHAPAIGRVCMALLGSQHEAEAALRETRLAELPDAASASGEDVRARLFGAARRSCARRLEARACERKAVTGGVTRATDAAFVSVSRRARELLSELRPTEREALVLRLVGGLSLDELARVCGIDAAAAQARVSRGLLRLRALLREEQA